MQVPREGEAGGERDECFMSARRDASGIDVRYVAALTRLTLTEEEVRRYQQELDAVVAYVARLQELDVEDVEPTAHAVPLSNVMREDAPEPCLAREKVLKNSPAVRDGSLIEVQAVLDEGGDQP